MTGPKTPDTASIDAELAALRQAYITALPEKLTALEEAVRGAVAGDPGAVQSAISHAHRIRGTAGSYGFETLGSCAGGLEDALLAWRPGHALAHLLSLLARVRAAALAAAGAPPPSGPRSRGRSSVSILVVDDDESLLQLLEASVAGPTLKLYTAASAQTALDVASSRRIDGAVIDVHLDRPSFPLADQLRAITGNPYLPIAFLSGDSSLDARIHAAHAGAIAYIDKPVDQVEFLATLDRMVRATRRTRDSILIADDDPDFVASTEAILLSYGYDVIELLDPDLVVSALDEHSPSALLIDMHMPRYTGAEICAVLRASERWRELPIIIATARADLESRIQAFEAGADDYLLKPFVEAELLARLRHRLERARLVKERVERDPHSGLLRRQAFLARFDAILSTAQRKGRTATLCLIDLDRFKAVNDTHGHLAGDDVIATFGALLSRRFRAEDPRGRWGGEEFIVAFAEEDAETIAGVMRRVLAEFREVSFDGRNGPFHVSFSAGLAQFPDDGQSARDLVATADRRLYAAKSAGRSTVMGVGEGSE